MVTCNSALSVFSVFCIILFQYTVLLYTWLQAGVFFSRRLQRMCSSFGCSIPTPPLPHSRCPCCAMVFLHMISDPVCTRHVYWSYSNFYFYIFLHIFNGNYSFNLLLNSYCVFTINRTWPKMTVISARRSSAKPLIKCLFSSAAKSWRSCQVMKAAKVSEIRFLLYLKTYSWVRESQRSIAVVKKFSVIVLNPMKVFLYASE